MGGEQWCCKKEKDKTAGQVAECLDRVWRGGVLFTSPLVQINDKIKCND